MAFKQHKVHLIGKSGGSDHIIIEATNVTQARQFAKDQYPSMKIGSVRAV